MPNDQNYIVVCARTIFSKIYTGEYQLPIFDSIALYLNRRHASNPPSEIVNFQPNTVVETRRLNAYGSLAQFINS
ncbi:hypothetical protein ACFQDD_06625, partial [Halorubrum pallidum]